MKRHLSCFVALTDWTEFNGAFPVPGHGITFDLQGLSSDPETEQIAKGFLRCPKLLAVLKDVRDRSRVTSHAPIILASLANNSGLAHRYKVKDAVSINATIQFMCQHESDDLVDAYGVHFYPEGESQGATSPVDDFKQAQEKYILAQCGKPKPCWITESGFKNNDFPCPVNDDARAVLVQEMTDACRPSLKQGKVTGEMYFSWDSEPGMKQPWSKTTYRCGQMTKSGKEAMEPLSR